MTFDEFAEYEAELYRRLVGLRGGCTCFNHPPCGACCNPMTEYEAELLGWETEAEPSIMNITRALGSLLST